MSMVYQQRIGTVFYGDDATHTELSYRIATFLLHTYCTKLVTISVLTCVMDIFGFLMGPAHTLGCMYRLCMSISYTPFSHDIQSSNAFLPSTVHIHTCIHPHTCTHMNTCTLT